MRPRLCSQCGAPLGAETTTCGYCGTDFDAVPDARHDDEHKLATPGCPRCHRPLRPKRIGKANIDLCEQCGGTWVGHAAMERLVSKRKRAGRSLQDLEARGGQRGIAQGPVWRFRRQAPGHLDPIPCPRCHRTLRLEPVRGQARVYVDVCERHGTWFDARELAAILRDRSRRKLKRSNGLAALEAGAVWAAIAGVGDIIEDVVDLFD